MAAAPSSPHTASAKQYPTETLPSVASPKKKRFDADALLVSIAPFVMGVLLVCCVGSIWLAADNTTPSAFSGRSLNSGNNPATTATAVLDWVSNSPDAVAAVVRATLGTLSGGR